MGFFAGELQAILQTHVTPIGSSPWALLTRLGVHPQVIDRIKKAADDIAQVATLPENNLIQLKQELELTPAEWARLQSGIEADTFFRLLMYHNYPLEEAANKANAVFAATLKDKLATGGKSDSVYAPLSEDATTAMIQSRPRRGRGPGRRPKEVLPE